MKLDKASILIIIACVLGLTIVAAHLNTKHEWLILTLLVPVAIILYAKRVSKKELENIDDER